MFYWKMQGNLMLQTHGTTTRPMEINGLITFCTVRYIVYNYNYGKVIKDVKRYSWYTRVGNVGMAGATVGHYCSALKNPFNRNRSV